MAEHDRCLIVDGKDIIESRDGSRREVSEDEWLASHSLQSELRRSEKPVRPSPKVLTEPRVSKGEIHIRILKAISSSRLKKKPLLKFLRENNPDVKAASLNRQLNNLIGIRKVILDEKKFLVIR